MTDEGKIFFVNYYSQEIEEYFEDKKSTIENLNLRLKNQKAELKHSKELINQLKK
jgi:hypothetical protein